MFLNTFKIFLILTVFITSTAFSQSVTFKVPDGWRYNRELSIKNEKLVFTQNNKRQLNREFLTEFLEIDVKKASAGADNLLWNNMIEYKKTFNDFKYYKPEFTSIDAIGTGCSIKGGFCIVQRIEYFENDLYIYTYRNNMPHYSQGLFGKWINIIAQIHAGKKSENKNEVYEI